MLISASDRADSCNKGSLIVTTKCRQHSSSYNFTRSFSFAELLARDGLVELAYPPVPSGACQQELPIEVTPAVSTIPPFSHSSEYDVLEISRDACVCEYR